LIAVENANDAGESEIMPPREPFTPVPIQGEPLSETIIRERLIAAPKIARPQEA
jgi:hypothetical protein